MSDDFDSLDAVAFTLAGERFDVVNDPPSGLLVDLVSAVSTDERGNRAYHGGAMRRALLALVPSPDHDRLLRVLGDKRRVVDRAVVGNLVMWLTEAVVSRPTARLGRSRFGPHRTGGTCGAVSSPWVRRWSATRPGTFSTWRTQGGSRTNS